MASRIATISLARILLANLVVLELTADISWSAERPNIVFILADDLGYGDLGVYGQTNLATPRIDRMATEGLRFTQHYAGSTVCAPSRACLMTGQHTGHVYQRFNGNVQFRPDPLDVTVAAVLKAAGYQTALIGKSGLSCRSQDGSLPNKKGFDHFFGYINHDEAHRYYPAHLWRDGEQVEFKDNHETEGNQYSTDLFLNDALDWLKTNAGKKPFFLHLSLQQPHADLNVPDNWRQPFVGRYDEIPFAGNHYRAEPRPKATFAGMVTHLDHCVGAILDQLAQLGVAENTLVLFSSDNGAMSEGGWSREYFASSGPLRGGKRDLYEGGIRVPLIVWWPGVVKAGRTTDHVSAFWDFLPTACDLAGIASPSGLDGVSYAPLLTGEGTQSVHDSLYWEFYEQGGKQALRRGNWKAIRLNVGVDRKGPLELYDLAKDPGETTDLAASQPAVVAELANLISAAHVDSPVVTFDRPRR